MSTVDELPPFALITFPPFPRSQGEISYSVWKTKGIWIPTSGNGSDESKQDDDSTIAQSPQPTDAYGTELIDITSPLDGTGTSGTAGPSRPRAGARGEGGILRLALDDCFKLGQEGLEWTEPGDTGRPEMYDESRPPFDRIIQATRDFLQSRHEAFQFHRTKRLFESMRYTFGLRTEPPGRHWPGSGENGQEYVPPRSTIRAEGFLDPDQIPQDEEVCVLLRNPEAAIRGFVALMRRETEAGWDMNPTHKLAEMLATFFTYIEHHKVFTDEPLTMQFKTAASLARQAPRSIRDANLLDNTLAACIGFNQMCWKTYGGQYGTAERGGTEDKLDAWPEHKVAVGGRGNEDSGLQSTAVVDPATLVSLLDPIPQESVKLLGHIPYARRRVTTVHPPSTEANVPAYQHTLYRVITVPAPWTDAEGWRRLSTDVRSGDHHQTNPLEGEKATIEEPDELPLWIEGAALPEGDKDRLVGMGLRGRWGLFGTDAAQGWWAFTAKDYVLPALWYDAGESTATTRV